MMPETEADSIPPGMDGNVYYSEGLETSYRSTRFRAAFPFGHGLTYTTFDYSPLTNETCSDVEGCQLRIRTRVTNTGSVTAPTVAQLYLGMPAMAGHPKPFLKGFKKTSDLSPGASEEVVFDLLERDVSFYDIGKSGFIPASGTFHAHVGESSGDIRRSLPFCIGPCDSFSLASAAIPLFGLFAAFSASGALAFAAAPRLRRMAAGGGARSAGEDDARPLVALQHDA